MPYGRNDSVLWKKLHYIHELPAIPELAGARGGCISTATLWLPVFSYEGLSSPTPHPVSASHAPPADLVGKAASPGAPLLEPGLPFCWDIGGCAGPAWEGGCTTSEQEARSYLEPEDLGCADPNGADLPG